MATATETPQVSVVIPTYNCEPWILETLRTVVAQQLSSMEVIVVDDASTDGTVALVDRFAADHPQVRRETSTGSGGGTARNTGARAARGDYLVFCDGDDLVPPGAYAALVASLEESQSDLAVGDYLKFRPTDTWRPTDRMPAFDAARRGVRVDDVPTVIFSRPCWNRMFRRDFWERSGATFPDVVRSNDIVPVVSTLMAAERIDVIEDCVYVYRERPGGSSMTARAVGAASVLSYLQQERQCAALVAGRADVGAVYRELVWQRDTYVAVARMLGARGLGDLSSVEAEVAAELSSLLDEVPSPDARPDRRALVLRLVAEGQWDAARALVTDERAPALDADEARRAWTAVLTILDRSVLDEAGVTEVVRWRVFDALRPRGGDEGVWTRLTALARDLVEPGQTRLPEFGADLHDAWRVREHDDVTLVEVRGGGRLELRGATTQPPNDVRIVLCDVDTGEALRPHTIRWREVPGGWRWAARYDLIGLPANRPLVPALAHGEGEPVTQLCGPVSLPAPSSGDAFTYERHPDAVTIRRRRARPVRVLGRYARAALQRLRG